MKYNENKFDRHDIQYFPKVTPYAAYTKMFSFIPPPMKEHRYDENKYNFDYRVSYEVLSNFLPIDLFLI